LCISNGASPPQTGRKPINVLAGMAAVEQVSLLVDQILMNLEYTQQITGQTAATSASINEWLQGLYTQVQAGGSPTLPTTLAGVWAAVGGGAT
ncbi:MAG: hypothetical protein ACP5I8_17570, partial [Phycisphaerae bacterium]